MAEVSEGYRLVDFSFVASPPDRRAVIRLSLWCRIRIWWSGVVRAVSSWMR